MEIITSVQNQFVKTARSLADKKFRDSTGLFLAEGVNLVKDIPSCADVAYYLISEERARDVLDLVDSSRARVYYVNERVMKSLSDTVNPFGIAAVMRKPVTDFLMPQGCALLLDGVSDPGNLGTILRTAAATDFKDVYLLDCADPYSPKAVRASEGGIFRVRVCAVGEKEALSVLENTESAGLDMNGENLLAGGFAKPITIAAGSEAHGLRATIASACGKIASLPMKNGIESLNVAVAVSVAMYQIIGR